MFYFLLGLQVEEFMDYQSDILMPFVALTIVQCFVQVCGFFFFKSMIA
jgi:hypothetical protein